jgi:hypothetical protein
MFSFLRLAFKNNHFSSNNCSDSSCLGAALYIYDFPGNVDIQNCSFVSNYAAFGGAFASALTSVNILDSTFTGNAATLGGGAVFWKYAVDYQVSIDAATVLRSSFNNAPYGALRATDLVSLSVNSSDDSFVTSSGEVLSSPLVVSILDYYGQRITNGSSQLLESTTVFCSVATGSNGTVRGSVIQTSSAGLAPFSDIVVSGKPGSFVTLQFALNEGEFAKPVFVTLFLRKCVNGEIEEISSDDTSVATCFKCGLGTYALHPDAKACSLCPEHVYCPGGDVLDLHSRYWRCDESSTQILECAIPVRNLYGHICFSNTVQCTVLFIFS